MHVLQNSYKQFLFCFSFKCPSPCQHVRWWLRGKPWLMLCSSGLWNDIVLPRQWWLSHFTLRRSFWKVCSLSIWTLKNTLLIFFDTELWQYYFHFICDSLGWSFLESKFWIRSIYGMRLLSQAWKKKICFVFWLLLHTNCNFNKLHAMGLDGMGWPSQSFWSQIAVSCQQR